QIRLRQLRLLPERDRRADRTGCRSVRAAGFPETSPDPQWIAGTHAARCAPRTCDIPPTSLIARSIGEASLYRRLTEKRLLEAQVRLKEAQAAIEQPDSMNGP
ncbi:MAG: hypothetical protein ACREJB_14215, partial [Planctomycetaceae bacterium]